MRRPTRRTFLAAGARTALGMSLIPAISCSRPQSGTPTTDASLALVIKDLTAQVPTLLESTRTPGLSIAVITNGRLGWSHAFGVASTASQAPRGLTTETIFNAASLSKSVFAYAVMKLHERRVLDLDVPLTRYLSERWVKDPRFDVITARHVLSHTGGLQNWRTTDDPLRIHFTPGTQWMYSGEGYSYLQSVVARLTGQDLDTFMRRNVFEPFGMPSTAFSWNAAFAERYATPHNATAAAVDVPRPTPAEVARYGSAGGLWTTVDEYATFLVEVLDPRLGDPFRLTRANRNQMIRPHVKVDDSSSWALGWRIIHGTSGDLISHGGENVGFQNFVAASIERKAGYIIMTNGDNGINVIAKLTNGPTPLNALFAG
jgi:CubicO group peptidase (beta-lactamase class C family)